MNASRAQSSEVTVQTDGWGGSRLQQSAGEAENGEWRTPALSHILQSLACGDFYPGLDLSRREGAGRLPRLWGASELARHTAWFCQTTSCSPPPASQLPGILAMVRVGFSRWPAVNGRACRAPALFSFVMRRLWGSHGSLPQLLRPEEERCQRIGPRKLSVASFMSQAATTQVGIQSFCLRSY